MKLKEYLQNHRVIADGAMGTYFEKKYPELDYISEKANIFAPDKVKQIHREYLESGARLLRTNTFASKTMVLGNMEEVLENVRAGYRLAAEAIEEYKKSCGEEQTIFLAANMGQLYPAEDTEDTILEEYKKICDAFLDCGAEIFIFETLPGFAYIQAIADYIRERSDAFILVQFAFDKSGYTKAGLSVSAMMQKAAALESVDAYGFNCGVAAAHLKQLLKDVTFPGNKFVSAMPNGSYPYELRGMTVYSNNENYYVRMMEQIAEKGIDILGGCCGTEPSYIKKLDQVLKNHPKAEKTVMSEQENNAEQRKARLEESSDLVKKMNCGEKVFVVELDPPFGLDISKVLKGSTHLKQCGCDLITLADSPMARARMDALQLAAKVQRECGIRVMPHVCCRDKNVIAMRSSLLGAYMAEIRNFLFITGDPVGRDSRDHVKSVFDFNSIKLMEYVKEMNEELFAENPVLYFGALNYHGVNKEAIVKRMKKKMEAGCQGFLTQPIYSKEDVERILYLQEQTNARILCGIMPLVSYKNAMFIKNEMPGIHVSDEIIERYQPDMSREDAEQTAVDISLEIVDKLYDKTAGFYFMTPFNRFGLVGKILEAIHTKYQ